MDSAPETTNELMVAMVKDHRRRDNVDREVAFTKTYAATEGEHPYVREIKCLRQQVPSMLLPMEPGDWFAGRLDRPLVGIDPERGDLVEAAYYCRFQELEAQLRRNDLSDQVRRDVEWLLGFWDGRTTYHRCRRAFPDHIRQALPADDYYTGREMAYPMFGLGGPCLDYGKLMRLGVRGLRAEVSARREHCTAERGDETIFLESLMGALDIFSEAALSYAEQARLRAKGADDAVLKRRCLLIAESTQHIADEPPQTYHQAIQLLWLYALVSLVKNYGRTDVLLGDFLVRDLDSGALNYEEAREMTVGLWRLFNTRADNNFNSRVIIGGKGRANATIADRFALLALEVQGLVKENMPQLSLRWHEGMNPEIRRKALDVIADGAVFPILYNDDVNVPAVAEAFGVPLGEAEQYFPYGCGEYVIDHMSIGSPDAAINLAKVLNTVLHGGTDPFTGASRGLVGPRLDEFDSFDRVRHAFARQVHHTVGVLADAQDIIYRITGGEAAFPFLSMLHDDCIERARPLLAGGARYRGGTLEVFGANTAADSLVAIRKLVYDEGRFSRQQLLEALDTDFENQGDVQRALRSAPKFGNDDTEADAMSLWVHEVVCRSCRQQRLYTGLDSFLAVMINNGDSITLGKGTAATADGRRSAMPLSNGNQPSAGCDTNGITALLASMSKLDPGMHAGAVHNLKISRRTFHEHPSKVDALLDGYFRSGGTQIMISVVDRNELEDALKHPEEHANLLVRVGGYAERFVNLPRDIQLEVIRRTLY